MGLRSSDEDGYVLGYTLESEKRLQAENEKLRAVVRDLLAIYEWVCEDNGRGAAKSLVPDGHPNETDVLARAKEALGE
jgi:hypothetical protein